MKGLNEIQQKLKAPKSKNNDFGGFKYRSAEQIYELVKPLLAEYGCEMILTDSIVCQDGWHYIKASALFRNADGEECVATGYAREEQTKKGMDSMQVTGSASSYARKYAMCGLFLIDGGLDADSNEYKMITAGDETIEPRNIKVLERLIKDTGTDITELYLYHGINDLSEIKNRDYKTILDHLEAKLK